MIVYVDMDDVICNYLGAYKKIKARNPEIAYPQSQYGFFAGLQPIAGAIDGVSKLMSSTKYDLFILTAPSVPNPMCYTEKRIWVEKWLSFECVKG